MELDALRRDVRSCLPLRRGRHQGVGYGCVRQPKGRRVPARAGMTGSSAGRGIGDGDREGGGILGGIDRLGIGGRVDREHRLLNLSGCPPAGEGSVAGDGSLEGDCRPGWVSVWGAVVGGSAIPTCLSCRSVALLVKAPGYRRPGHPCPEPVPSLHSEHNLSPGVPNLNKYKFQPFGKLFQKGELCEGFRRRKVGICWVF
jgi:hypothetical protein